MRKMTRIVTLAAAAVTVAGLSVGAATAGPTAAGTQHLTLHGTGGLRPDIHLSRGNRPALSPQGLPIQYSGNWSGYVALPKSGGASTFKYAAASYSVPSVNCGVTSYAFAYQWVGLDGDTDGTVEQDGVGSYCVNGSPTYFAWSEMYPAGVAVQFYLNAGDAVHSSVTFNGSGSYTLALTDLTSGQSFSVNGTCAQTCNNSSAEVITEGYPSGSYTGTADFGAENYDGIQIEGGGGHKGGIKDGYWTTDESIAKNGSDITTEPGALYTSSNPASPELSAFQDNWINVA